MYEVSPSRSSPFADPLWNIIRSSGVIPDEPGHGRSRTSARLNGRAADRSSKGWLYKSSSWARIDSAPGRPRPSSAGHDLVVVDEVHDADGDPIVGEQNYVLHFEADQLPPAAAFWSVTMYDAEGFQAANELNRFALGDPGPLQYNEDGSLDIYLQHTNPGPDKEANWLPAPLGALGINMRLYAPAPEALDGRWHPPIVTKA